MAAGRKQVAFDLDTDALKIYYPSESWNNAYDIIKRHMTNNGFNWLQGSVYVSQKPITSAEVTNILDELVQKNPWLNVCMRDCRETNIGREHNKNHIFNKDVKVLTREEMNAQRRQEQQGSLSDYKAEIEKMRQNCGRNNLKEPKIQRGDKGKNDR